MVWLISGPNFMNLAFQISSKIQKKNVFFGHFAGQKNLEFLLLIIDQMFNFIQKIAHRLIFEKKIKITLKYLLPLHIKSHFLRKSGNLRKWPSSNFLVACILFKIHVIKKKQKTVLKKSILYLRFWPPKFLWFLRDFPFFILFVTLELNYRQQYRWNTYIYIWIGWLDGSLQKKN